MLYSTGHYHDLNRCFPRSRLRETWWQRGGRLWLQQGSFRMCPWIVPGVFPAPPGGGTPPCPYRPGHADLTPSRPGRAEPGDYRPGRAAATDYRPGGTDPCGCE